MVRILNISNLNKSYNNAKVLNDINFYINKGEVFGLLGLNGVGKTTIIKSILKIIKIESGEIELFSENIINNDNIYNKVRYLPEKFSPPSLFTGIDVVKTILNIYSKEFDIEKLHKMCAYIDFNIQFLNQKIKDYSKGMVQKISLISFVLSDGDFYILDEPSSGLDPVAVQIFMKIIKDLKSRGKTIMMTSHVLHTVNDLCDRIAVIHNGKIPYIGTNDVLLRNTKSDDLYQAFLNIIGS